MEADLDLADKLHPNESELSGDDLISKQYSSQNFSTTNVQKSYNNILYASSTTDLKLKASVDPVLHRPTTPGQFRQSIVAQTVDSLANSLAVSDVFHSQTNGQSSYLSTSMKKPLSASTTSTIKSANNNNNNRKKFSNTSVSITRPKSATRASTNLNIDQQKQLTPVLAFSQMNDELDRSIPTLTQKMTPPMKFSFAEPPRSNSSASIRSSTSSTLELSNGTTANQKSKKL